jgi:hypothetical protein
MGRRVGMRPPTVRLWFTDGTWYDTYYNMYLTIDREGVGRKAVSTLFLRAGDVVHLPDDAEPPREKGVFERLEPLGVKK